MIISVTELNSLIKEYFDLNPVFTSLYVKGEISNFKKHSSGHCYFSLKDEKSVIKAVMFKFNAYNLQFEPENGMKVILNARLSSYERDGVYQLYVNEMQPDGIGALHIKFEKLKEKLSKEGLFDERYKKQIPRFPKTIGVVTSPTGAAIRDIINVLKRRWKNVDIIIYPAQVQGEDAHLSIISGIKYFNENKVDVIIIGRGGGSVEDLWCFNEEEVAREIFKSTVPLISAVGHETDYTISDFVADLRAPTPSAAAELSVPSVYEVMEFINSSEKRMYLSLLKKIEFLNDKINMYKNSNVLKHPERILEKYQQDVSNFSDKLLLTYSDAISKFKERYIKNVALLDGLSPLKVLKRGYTFVEDDNGKVLDSVKNIISEDIINLKFADGKARCKVISREEY
ncbi:MAG: exodeoxyribonuclease VII large subunit [Ruminococcaceae bacterium]|nr:exodeoxyribonuclease VII large subunit [Oscillospiraceae bacterium]